MKGFLWKNRLIGGNGLRHLFVAFYSLAVCLCSLPLSLLFISPTYASETVDYIHELTTDVNSVDMNDYTIYNDIGNSSIGVVYVDNQPSVSISGSVTSGTPHGSLSSPTSWNYSQGSYAVIPSSEGSSAWEVPGSNSGHNAVKLTCNSHKFYIGSSMSFTGVSLSNPSLYYNYLTFSSGGGPYTTNSNNFLDGEVDSQDIISVYSNATSRNTVESVFEFDDSSVNSLYFTGFDDPQWKFDQFYVSDSNNATYSFNGFVIGCSENHVKSLIQSLDPNPVPSPTPTSTFPNSFDSDDSVNNEDAWNILNNLDPDDFSFQNQDSDSILTWVLDFFRNIALIEPSLDSCNIYTPAFFGNNFSFGNGSSDSLLYVNLCSNPFVTSINSNNTLIGTLFSQSQYGDNSYFYIGIKGLIWVFCGWVLVKIMLGYVYWVYGFIDFVFGTNEGGAE